MKIFYILLLLFGMHVGIGQNHKLNIADDDLYFFIDDFFINSINDSLVFSKRSSIDKELAKLLKNKKRDTVYLKNLETSKSFLAIEANAGYFTKIIKQFKKNKVKTIFFIDVFLNGDEFNFRSIIFVLNLDGTVQYFNSNKQLKKEYNIDFIDALDDFSENIALSSENKTKSTGGNFTIYKINAIGKNKYRVTSKVINEMLLYQYYFIDLL